jgi:hypothetical protein
MEDTNIQAKKSFLSSKEIVKSARKFYKENFKKLWPLYILGGLGGMSFSYRSSSGNSANSTPSPYLNIILSIPWWVWVLVGIVIIVISIFLFISKISLLKGISDTHKGQFVGVRDSYKKGLAIFWSFILIGIMVSFSVFGAMVLLIIPGIILSVYLVFSVYELIDKQKKGFQALLGSWSLIRGNWWKIVGKTIMIGLRILIIGLLYFLAILIPTLILLVLGTVLHVAALSIIGISLGVLAFLCVCFGFLAPLSMIAMFELYYNFCDVRELNKVVDETLDKKRKRKLIISMVIGIVSSILIIVGILVAIVLVNVNQYAEKAKNSIGNYSTSSIVGEIKKNLVLPYKVDSMTSLTDIIAEPNAVRYQYIISGGDTSGLTNDLLKQSLISSVCGNKSMKDVLQQNINFEYSYAVEGIQKTFFVTVSKTDCP